MNCEILKCFFKIFFYSSARANTGADPREQEERHPAGDVVEGDVRGTGVPGGHSARPHHQRAGGRGVARRGFFQRGHRHADLRERVSADSPRDEEGHPQPDAADEEFGGECGFESRRWSDFFDVLITFCLILTCLHG